MSAPFLFPYTSPKAFAFRILVELAAVFYLYLALKYPARFFPFFEKYSILHPPFVKGGKGGFIGFAVLVFFIVNLLSAIFGLDFYHSFWGNLERMGGIWGLLHFVTWFFMLVAVFGAEPFSPFSQHSSFSSPLSQRGARGDLGDKRFYYRLIQLSVFTSVAVSSLAILQKFFSLGDLLPQAARVSSTIGNPAFLGAYLLFNIFFAGYLAISEFVILSPARSEAKNSLRMQAMKLAFARDPSLALRRGRDDKQDGCFWIILYSLFIILNSVALLFTGTRGAYLGLAAGAIVFLGLLLFFAGRSLLNPPFAKGGLGGFKKLSVIVLFIIVIFGGVLFLARNFSFVKNNSVLARLTSVSLSDKTIQSRLILWQDAWRVWLQRPVLGFGAENFEAATNPHLSAQLFSYEAFSLDRAHNFIFDYGVASGWIGLAAYLSIFAAAGWRLKKINDCHSESRAQRGAKNLSLVRDDNACFYFAAVFGGLLAAYLVQNFFVFDSFVSYLMLFFTLGTISGRNLSLRGAAAASTKQSRATAAVVGDNGGKITGLPRNDGLIFYKKFILSVFAILVIFSLYSFNVKPLRAAYLANQILSWPSENQAQIASRLADMLSLDTFAANEVVYQVAIDYLVKVSAGQLTLDENFYKVAGDSLAGFIRREPAQSRNYIALAWLNLYFSDERQGRINEALALAVKAKELNPNKKDVFLLLTAGYALSGQSDKAQETVLRAEAVDAKMGKEVREYWEKLK